MYPRAAMSARAAENAWGIDPDFCSAFQIEFAPPAAASAIEAIERLLGRDLPAVLARWYRAADGGRARAPGSALELLSLEKVERYFDAAGWNESYHGFFPFVENDDSNPICLCCKGPLAGYVVQVPHDDARRLLYRSPSAFFRDALPDSSSAQYFDTHDLQSEFDAAERTEGDLRIARSLTALATAPSRLDEMDRIDALQFACDLLPAGRVSEMRALCELGNEYVAEHVLARLKRIDSAEARQAAREMVAERDDFVEQCAALLRREGIEAVVTQEQGSKGISLQPGPVHLNMDMFFARRRAADFAESFLARVRALLSRKR